MDELTKARIAVIRRYIEMMPNSEGRFIAIQMCDRLEGIPGVFDAATDSEVSAGTSCDEPVKLGAR